MKKEACRYASNLFLNVYLIFSLGVVLAATALAALSPKVTAVKIRRFAGFEAKFILLLLFAERASFVGTVFFQRAIDLSPSPSFVAAVESSVPVFVMLLSLLLATVFARLNHEHASTMFRNQMLGWKENEVSVEANADFIGVKRSGRN